MMSAAPQAAAPHAAAISSTSSTASTASAPSTTTNAGTSTNIGRGKGKAKARTSYTDGGRLSIQDVHAVVRWWQHESEQGGQPGGELRDILFNLHFDPRPNQEAFFKLHTRVRLKAVRNSKVSMYLWIPPERIRSLAFTADDDDDDDDDGDGITLTAARHRLPNTSSVGLVFKLHEPAVLIGPNISLTPSSKADGSVLDSLRVLAQGTRLAVYLPRRRAPNKDQLQSLCRAILPGSARLAVPGDTFRRLVALVSSA
ncbi:hypothetical protein F5883DRAFT_582955 [Diaporthe sp. PMI_573]|nr:hypothetical protein F5883DRAFT_582955 [Diaporthaceae sp. PMI_573]